GSTILCMPGVPFEMEAMANRAIDRALDAADERGQRATMALRLVGRSEAELDTSLGSLMDRDANPLLGLTVQEGEVRLHMTARPEAGQSAEKVLAEGERRIRAALGKNVRVDGGMVDLLAALRAKGWRIATAESCTGGLLADRITDVPGASDVFAGGTVAYTPQMKVAELGVRSETVQREGVVSEAVAREMAEGICTRTGAQVGVGLTGIAGPGGGTKGVPEGQVCIAIRSPGGLTAETRVFVGGRRRVKERAVSTAVRLLLDLLGGGPGEGRTGPAR
ncbi:MAG: nicotinamide-nucleotide amidohydrolase family protein, partial [Planctomycetota bacterium]|nr:nicotinamide-nucleotide amidohydrolase family protein [Planctomycetota bacterium]